MKQKTIVISIIILIVLIIITSIITIVTLKKAEDSKNENITRHELPVEETEEDQNIELSTNLQKVKVRNDFYIVKNIIVDFYKNWTEEEDRAEKLKSVYNRLDKEYIKYKEITPENIETQLKDIQKIDIGEYKLYIKNVYFKENELGQKIYLTECEFASMANNNKYNFSTIVNIDTKNETYSLILNDYISEKIGKVGIDSKIEYEFHQIDKNEYNQYEYKIIEDKEYVSDLFKDMKYQILSNTEEAYNILSETYRNQRFGSLENFRKYVKENYTNLQQIKASGYQVNNDSEKKQYIIKDQFENLYIFEATSVMNYTVKLDTYTIPEPSFNLSYDEADNQTKVQMNIDKFFKMLNRQDYRSSYKCLANSFKSKNVKTEQEFENTAKKIFFLYNKVEYLEYKELENNIYSYSIRISDLTGKSKETKIITIAIQLNENRNFVMSFSVKQ